MMMREGMLQRTTERVTSYIQQYVTLAGAEKREEVFRLFDNMQHFFPHWGIMTCQHMHPDILYMSDNCPYILGHSYEYLDKNNSIHKYFDHVHEADQADLHSCFAFQHDYLQAILPEQHQYYRSVFHYRFKTADGQSIYLQDEKAVLNLNGEGNLYYYLVRDVTAEKAFNGVKIELYRHEHTLKKINEYKPSARHSRLSKREGELVTLIKQGLSTKEIAWYLKISHHTVRNIKSKLFEKYKVNNTVELLNMTA
ncbi:MAG: hypothetical protein H7Y86_16690 [Rhizobacter sp.]|nr:hypothetical protein [Ferruginibacter sp.]